jgi:hypothetical protein
MLSNCELSHKRCPFSVCLLHDPKKSHLKETMICRVSIRKFCYQKYDLLAWKKCLFVKRVMYYTPGVKPSFCPLTVVSEMKPANRVTYRPFLTYSYRHFVQRTHRTPLSNGQSPLSPMLPHIGVSTMC